MFCASWSDTSGSFAAVFRPPGIRHLLRFNPLTLLWRSVGPFFGSFLVLGLRQPAFLCRTLGGWGRRVDPRRDSKLQFLYNDSLYFGMMYLWTTVVLHMQAFRRHTQQSRGNQRWTLDDTRLYCEPLFSRARQDGRLFVLTPHRSRHALRVVLRR